MQFSYIWQSIFVAYQAVMENQEICEWWHNKLTGLQASQSHKLETSRYKCYAEQSKVTYLGTTRRFQWYEWQNKLWAIFIIVASFLAFRCGESS